MSYAKMLKEIELRGQSVHEISEGCGLHYTTVRHAMNALRKSGLAHVVGWRKDSMGRDTTALWLLGFGVDALRACKQPARRVLRAIRIKQALVANLGVFTPSMWKQAP